jgi:hypothetical protein
MELVLDVVNWLMAHYQVVLSGLVAVFSGLITIFMLIPGDQPEKFLQGVVDFVAKFSKK